MCSSSPARTPELQLAAEQPSAGESWISRKKKYDLCSFTSKPFNITVSQVYGPTTNAEEAEVERFYEDLQDLRELTPPKDVLFIIGDWNAKVGSQETPGCCC